MVFFLFFFLSKSSIVTAGFKMRQTKSLRKACFYILKKTINIKDWGLLSAFLALLAQSCWTSLLTLTVPEWYTASTTLKCFRESKVCKSHLCNLTLTSKPAYYLFFFFFFYKTHKTDLFPHKQPIFFACGCGVINAIFIKIHLPSTQMQRYL